MDLELTVNQALSLLASDHPPLLLDVREPWEFLTAHIQASVIIPMNEIPGREEAHILVVCHHGARSLSVANWLRGQGFEKAQSISGGIDAWSTHIDPTVPRY
jgi:rhodanese-related sulfurtransferase